MIAVLLLAAGRGSRFGGDCPKQYLPLDGVPLIVHTLRSLAVESRIRYVLPVIAKGDDFFATSLPTSTTDWPFDLLPPVIGGSERACSMQQGLAALPEDVQWVAIHDAARPFPSAELLRAVFDAALKYGAAIPGLAVHDTIKRIHADGCVQATLPRHELVAVQTPQVMRKDWLQQALQQEAERLHCHTDDASVLEAAGFPVHVTPGEAGNRKVTTQDDLHWLSTMK